MGIEARRIRPVLRRPAAANRPPAPGLSPTRGVTSGRGTRWRSVPRRRADPRAAKRSPPGPVRRTDVPTPGGGLRSGRPATTRSHWAQVARVAARCGWNRALLADTMPMSIAQSTAGRRPRPTSVKAVDGVAAGEPVAPEPGQEGAPAPGVVRREGAIGEGDADTGRVGPMGHLEPRWHEPPGTKVEVAVRRDVIRPAQRTSRRRWLSRGARTPAGGILGHVVDLVWLSREVEGLHGAT